MISVLIQSIVETHLRILILHLVELLAVHQFTNPHLCLPALGGRPGQSD